MLSCDCSDFLQWLNRTDFIVCCHNRNQNRIRTDSCLQLVQLYFTIFIYIDIGNFISLFLQPLRSMQNRMMLNGSRDNMLSLIGICFCSCLQCPVIRFTSATGEINFFCFSTDHIGNRLTGMIHTALCFSCKTVNCRRITIVFCEIWYHCV